MVAPLLAVQYRSGSAPQVGTVTGVTYSQIGDDLTTSLETGNSNYFPMNRAITAFGGVYAMQADGIHKLQTGSREGEWSKLAVDGGIDFTNFPILGDITGGLGTDSHKGGIYYTVLDDDPYIFGWIATGVNTMRMWKMNLLTGVPEASSNIAVTNWIGFRREILFNGQIIHWQEQAQFMLIMNPATLTVTSFVASIIRKPYLDFDIFKNRLILQAENPSSGAQSICEMVGSQVVELFTLPGGNEGPGSNQNRRHMLFSDGTDLYTIYRNPSGGLWRMYIINDVGGTLTLGTELTSSLPSAIVNGGADARLYAVKVYNTDGTSDTLVYHATSGDATWAQYLWEGVNNGLTLQDQLGATAQLAMTTGKNGTGDRAYVGESATVTLYRRERVSGGERVTFRVHPPVAPDGSSVTTGLVVRFFQSTNGGPPDTQSQLIGSVTGGSAFRNGNQVEGVDADDTDYTAVIQAVGFGDFDKIELTARVSVS